MPQLVQWMLGLVLKYGFDVLHHIRGEFVQDFSRFQGFFELLSFGCEVQYCENKAKDFCCIIIFDESYDK
jgi:hypothetical protein